MHRSGSAVLPAVLVVCLLLAAAATPARGPGRDEAAASLTVVHSAEHAGPPDRIEADRPDPGSPADPAGPADPVALLRQRIASGEATLAWDSAHGYLPALLDALDIPVSSQTLVFSRTSLQTDRIGPWAPRALYFSDDVYVGWVQESPTIEIASIDPDLGTVFYTLSQVDPADPVLRPRSTTCLMCHESRAVTGGPPGLIVMSVLVDRLGYPIGEVHPGSTTDRVPWESRWGGWYVSGTHGDLRHSGNVHAEVLSHEVSAGDAYASDFDYGAGSNVTDLSGYFYTDAYLTPHSDIVALLVLTHQVQVHNLMGLVRAETEAALELEALQLRSGRGEVGERGYLPSTVTRVAGSVDRLFRAMIFADEMPLVDPIAGTSAFAAEFPEIGPTDEAGRSLRDLDLRTRLARHRLSFLVHSDAFRAMPELPRMLFAEQLLAVLEGTAPSDLGPDERDVILSILRATEPHLLALGGVAG